MRTINKWIIKLITIAEMHPDDAYASKAAKIVRRYRPDFHYCLELDDAFIGDGNCFCGFAKPPNNEEDNNTELQF